MGPAEAEARAIARSAAGIYAGAMLIGLVEEPIPGGPTHVAASRPRRARRRPARRDLRPAAAAQRPRPARAVRRGGDRLRARTTHGWTDGAVMYMWPVLWMAHFYGRRGTVFIVAWVGVVHGLALVAMPAGVGNFDRWVDVVGVGGGRRRGGPRPVRARRPPRRAPRRGGPRRRAHRPAQPPRLRGAPRRRGRARDARRPLARGRAPSTSTTSSASTTSTATRRATACCDGRAVIADHVRGADVAARWGGEEFVVVLPGRRTPPAARAFAERVRAAIAASGRA